MKVYKCDSMDFCGVPCEFMKRIVETEIDKLNAEKNDVMYHKAQIKAEAIKEFAERLKKELSLCKKECRKFLDNDGAFAIDKARKKVDILVKEMVGADNV